MASVASVADHDHTLLRGIERARLLHSTTSRARAA
jgi:hypothetical protein